MTYTYPDHKDRLTCRMIEDEYDGVYRGASEAAVLDYALAALASFRYRGTDAWGDVRVNLFDVDCGELITTFNRVENLSISEIGELEKVMLISQEIEPIIEKVKYPPELLESELDLLYQTGTNRLGNFLTVAGLLLATMQVIEGLR